MKTVQSSERVRYNIIMKNKKLSAGDVATVQQNLLGVSDLFPGRWKVLEIQKDSYWRTEYAVVDSLDLPHRKAEAIDLKYLEKSV